MATTQASDQYVEFDEFVDYHLTRTRASIKLTDVLTAIVGISVLVVGYLLVFTLLDHWVVDGGFGFAARASMLALIVVVAIAWVAWKVVLPWLKPVNRLYAAGVIEGAEPELKNSLFNLVDLSRSTKSIRPEVRRAMEKQAAVRLSEVDVDNSVDRRTLMRFAYALLFLVVVSCLYAVMSPKKISFLRTLTLADAEVATRTEILSVTPGDVDVIAGDQVEVTVDLKGEVPESVRIFYSLDDRSVVDEPVEMREVEDGIRQFNGIINGTNGRGILQDMTYHVTAGDARSDDFRITVNRPPSALIEGITLTFPEYMETPEHRQSNGHIDAYEGTLVKLTASANMPLKLARLEFFDEPGQKGEQRSLRIEGTNLTTQWPLAMASDGTFQKHYRIYVENENGDTDPNPTTYNVNIKRDKAPEIALLDPVRDVELPANGVLPLLLQASDPDFKLRSIALRFQRVGVEFEQSESIYDGLTEGFHKAWAGQHEFRLSGRGFEAGDIVRFWLEARDNRPPLGNRAATLPLKIRIVAPVSTEEAEKRLEEDRKQQESVLDEIREQQQDAAQDQAGDTQSDSAGPAPGDDPKTGNEPQDDSNENREPGDDPFNPDAQPDKGQPGQANEPPQDDPAGNGSSEQQERSDKARDDEALQKMIEKLQQDKPEDVGGNLKSDPDQSQPADKAGDNSDSGDVESNPSKLDPAGKQPNESSETQPKPQTGENTAPGDNKAKSQPGDVSSGEKKPSDNSPDKEPTKSGEGDTPVNRDDPELNKTGESSKGGESKTDDGNNPPEKQPGQGDETGEAKAGDADAETNQANQPDDLNRQPGEKPTLRDADGKQPNDQSPSKPEPGTDPEQPTQGDNKPNGDPETGDKNDPANSGESGSKQKPGSQQDPANQANEDGKPGSDSKPGDPQGGKQPGESKPGESGESGDPKDGGESKGGESKSGESKGGESKGGESKGGESKGGESKGGESNGGESKGGESKGGESKGGESKGGESKGGESKGGESKGGESKGGESKGGESKGGESKGGESKGGEGGGAGKSSDPGDGAGGSEGAGKGGSTSSSGKSAGTGAGGGGDAGDQSNQSGAGDGGGGTGDPGEGTPDDPNLLDAKKAANLVLDKLNKELKRGEIDEKLLKELGWDEKDLADFVERMKKQLAQQQADEVSPKTEAQRKRFEEMLKSLDLEKGRSRRAGSSDRDRTMKGINTRQIQAPAEYRDAFEEYKRSLSRKKK